MSDKDIYLWAGIVGLMLVTIATRSFLIALPKDISLPGRLARALRFAPIAALVAIIVPDVAIDQGHLVTTLVNPKLWSALAAILTWHLTRQTVAAIGAGLAVFLLGRFLVGL